MYANWVIIHGDFNGFYTACECVENPNLWCLPVAVAGEKKYRHGVVISVNQVAKLYGVKVGDTTDAALRKCPKLILLPPRKAFYKKMSDLAKKEIFAEYSDHIQNYGDDGLWIDVTVIAKNPYDARFLADDMRMKCKERLGLPLSAGVSFNKTISKLASELKKPDATTVVSKEKFKQIVWPLSPDHLLGVGQKLNQCLYTAGITDIGNIAKAPIEVFEEALGKNGITLHKYASGEERSPVKHKDYVEPTKTLGHTHTTQRDMKNLEDVRHEIYSLSERAASEIREQHFRCRTIQVEIRDNDLKWCNRMGKLKDPSYITKNIAEKAMEIFMKQYRFTKPLRSLGIRVSDLVSDDTGMQSDFFDDYIQIEKMENLAFTMDKIRSMYGYDIVNWAYNSEDKKLTDIPDEYNRASYRVGSAYLKDA